MYERAVPESHGSGGGRSSARRRELRIAKSIGFSPQKISGEKARSAAKKANVPQNPGDVAANYIDAARYFLVRTRWERTGLIPK